MKVLLDTNFIMTCVKQKIDFFDRLDVLGFAILIPKQVIGELEKVYGNKNKKLKNRDLAEISLKILNANKERFVCLDLGKKHVDKLIVKYANEHPRLVVATLDSELKKKLKNSKMVIRDMRKLVVV